MLQHWTLCRWSSNLSRNGAAPVQIFGFVVRYVIYEVNVEIHSNICKTLFNPQSTPKLHCKEKLRTHNGGKEFCLTSHFKAFPRPKRPQNKLVPDSSIALGCFMSYTGNTESVLTLSLLYISYAAISKQYQMRKWLVVAFIAFTAQPLFGSNLQMDPCSPNN